MEPGGSDLLIRLRRSTIQDNANHFFNHYPGISNMVCNRCNENFNLERIWELTGCDCDSEAGTINCGCGNIINFILHLNYTENKEHLISSLLTEDPSFITEFHINNDILGEVRLTFNSEEGIILTFMNNIIKRNL